MFPQNIIAIKITAITYGSGIVVAAKSYLNKVWLIIAEHKNSYIV
jgi:hypothetical protein